MTAKALEKIIEGGVRFLSEILPVQSYLYFPLLYSAAVWAVRRTARWKEEIFSWKVWPDPGIVAAKPDAFILSFFVNTPALRRTFEDEIRQGNLKALKEAFHALYPVVGLEEPFLQALFFQELESGDYRKVVREFDARVIRAKEDVKPLADNMRFVRDMKAFFDDAASLSAHLISQAKVQKAVAKEVKKILGGKND